MFNKMFPARIRGLALGQKRMKGADEDETLCIVTVNYDLTDELAGAIGGAAPAVQEMLAKKGDGVKMHRAGLVLDADDVTVKFQAEKDWSLTVERTRKLKAYAKQANAEDVGPTLECKVAFKIDDDEALLFLRPNLGQLVKVRMDRRQLEMSGVTKPGDDGGDPK